MITKIVGKLIEKKEQALTVNIGGIYYDIIVPESVISRIDQTLDKDGNIHLVTYYYFQIGPASGFPILIGFINEVEREFFQQFIKVSGIGPRAAVKALNKPIADITHAIDEGDIKFLQTLPGIGLQRAKEIIAKLQGKIGKFGLIRDYDVSKIELKQSSDWQEEALSVLIQLQYNKNEAQDMIQKAIQRSDKISSTEELLNEIYKQKVTI